MPERESSLWEQELSSKQIEEGLASVHNSAKESMEQQLLELQKTIEQAREVYARRLQNFQSEAVAIQASIAEQARKSDFSAVFTETKRGVIAFARSGWTVPATLPFSDFLEFAKLPADALDRQVVNYYRTGEWRLLDSIRNKLMADAELSNWCVLLDSIIEAIKDGKHVLVIPCLFTVIEGFVVRSVRAHTPYRVGVAKMSRVADDILPRLVDSETSSILRNWRLIHCFELLTQIFKYHPFEEEPPSLINRHWVLHGRSVAGWSVCRCRSAIDAAGYAAGRIHGSRWSRSTLLRIVYGWQVVGLNLSWPPLTFSGCEVTALRDHPSSRISEWQDPLTASIKYLAASGLQLDR
jgi:hypothetical protein